MRLIARLVPTMGFENRSLSLIQQLKIIYNPPHDPQAQPINTSIWTLERRGTIVNSDVNRVTYKNTSLLAFVCRYSLFLHKGSSSAASSSSSIQTQLSVNLSVFALLSQVYSMGDSQYSFSLTTFRYSNHSNLSLYIYIYILGFYVSMFS